MPDAIEDRILERVRGLRAGTTMCPGRLSRDLGFKLADLRSIYVALANAGRLCIRQHGHPANPETLRGPFRVAPIPPQASSSKVGMPLRGSP